MTRNMATIKLLSAAAQLLNFATKTRKSGMKYAARPRGIVTFAANLARDMYLGVLPIATY